MNLCRMLALASGMATLLSVPVARLEACGPFFPASYFDGVDDHADSNAEEQRWSTWRLAPDRIEELRLIGEFYYPAWMGRKIQGNTVKSSQAHQLDFQSAGRQAGVGEAEIEAAYQRFLAFETACREACEKGQPIDIPADCGIFEEFFLYALGFQQFRANPQQPLAEAWKRLLALEPARRHYRTVFVYHCLVLYAGDHLAQDNYLTELRRALDAGFQDTAGLEAAVLKYLVRNDPRFMPLVFAVKDPQDPLAEEMKFFLRSRSGEWAKNNAAKLMNDKIGREILLVVDSTRIADMLDGDGNFRYQSDGPILCADRQAWRAFHRGEFDLARQLLRSAAPDSLITLYVGARLDRLRGNLQGSAQKLRRWLEVYAANSRRAPRGVSFGSSEGYYYPLFDPKDPSMFELVNGELGTVLVERSDFLEALAAFVRAESSIDAAFVGERILSVDELAAWLDAHAEAPEELRHLLARRMMREYRVKEAGKYFPAKWQELYQRYVRLVQAGNDPARPADERALAFYNLSRVVSAQGMELFGTELEPDCYINDGNYAISGLPEELLGRVEGGETQRFHYTRRAANLALRASGLAVDRDLKNASLILGYTVFRGRDPRGSEVFFQLLADSADVELAALLRETNSIPLPVTARMRQEIPVEGDRTLPEIQTLVQSWRSSQAPHL